MEGPQRPPSVSEATLAAFRAAAETITQTTVQRAMAFEEEVAHHGEEAEELLHQGLVFTTKGLDTAMAFHTFDLLADQLEWGIDRLPHHGVDPEHVLHRLELYREVVAEVLAPEHATAVNAYVDWMIEYQRRLMAASS